MTLYTLDQFRRLKRILTKIHKAWISAKTGVEIPESVSISLSARVRGSRRAPVRIGDETLIAFKTLIYTFDVRTERHRSVSIGRQCFIGGGSVITPGVTIGDGCIVGAGSVVFDDVPSGSIVGGNPARTLRSNVQVGPYGVLPVAEENTARYWVVE